MNQSLDIELRLTSTISLIFCGKVIIINHYKNTFKPIGVGVLCDEKNAISTRTELSEFIESIEEKKEISPWVF